jgi:hypothetical protein
MLVEKPKREGDTMSDEIFLRIAQNIDQGPLTAPRGEAGFADSFIKFLKLVYSPEQAEVVQHLKMGMKFTSAADLSGASGRRGRAI